MSDVKIQISDNVSDFIRKLDEMSGRLDVASAKTRETGDNIHNAFTKAGEGAKSASKETNALSDTLEKASRAGSGLATTMELFGAEAGAGAQHVRLMNQALQELTAAALPLLAAMAALEVAFKGFAFLKDSVDGAGKLQQSMAILGSTVTAQGGNWHQLSQAVMAYADAQERTTAYSRNEVIQAMTQLTSAGMNVAEAMQVNRIAEDASAATGQSLVTINHALVEAMHGRTQALTMLGIGTKQSIKDGMSFHDVLVAIEKQMGGAAAAAANTYPGALAQLSNAFESLKEDIGTAFLPVLTDMVHRFHDFIENDGPAITKWANDFAQAVDQAMPVIAQDVSNTWTALSDFFKLVSDHKDEIEAFFSAVIAVKAVNAINALRASLVNLKLAEAALTFWSGAQLVFEAVTAALMSGGGLVAAIKAFTGSLIDLGAAEAVASAGLTLLGPAVIGGTIYAFLHFREIVDFVGDALNNVVGAIGHFLEWEGHMIDRIPIVNSILHNQAQGLIDVGNAAEKASNQYRDYVDAQRQLGEQSDISKRMAGDESILANPKGYLPSMVQHAQQDLNDALASMHGAPASPAKKGNPPTIPGDNTRVGGGSKGGSSKPSDSLEPSAYVTNTADDYFVQSHKNLENALKAADDSLGKYKTAVLTATTQEQKSAAEKALLAAQTQVLTEKHTLLNNAVAAEDRAVAKLAGEYEVSKNQTNALIKQKNDLIDKIKATGVETEADKKHLADLNAEIAVSTKKHDDLGKKLNEVKNQLDQDTQSLQNNTVALGQNGAAVDALTLKHNTFIETMQREDADLRNTYGKSNAQQIAYYEQQMAALDRTTAEGEQLWEEYFHKIQSLREQDFTKFVDTQKQELADVTTFIDAIVIQHKSLKDELKSIYDDILKNYIDMMAKMIMESTLFKAVTQSGFFQGVMNGLGFGSASGNTNPFPGGNNPLTKSSTDLTNSATHLTTASQQIVQDMHQPEQNLTQSGSTLQQSGGALQQAAQQLDNAAQALQGAAGGGGGSGSGSSILSMLGGGSGSIPEFNTGDVFNVPGAPGVDSTGAYMPNTNINDTIAASQQQISVTSATSPTNVTLDSGSVKDLSKSVGSVFGGALMGFSMGQSMAPGNPWASGLGAVGGAAGEYFGGPVGEFIGSTVGAFVGSLFGPHWGPAVNYPDRSDTQNFGTEAADMTGAGLNGKPVYNANGTPFSEQTSLSQASGGQSGLSWVEETLAKYATPGTTQMSANAPDWLKPIWNQLVSAFGVSATGSGQLNFGTHIGDQWVTGASGAGGVDPNNPGAYQTYAQLLNQFYQGMQGTPGAESVFNISNMAPDYNAINMSQIGTYDPTTGTFAPTNGSGSGGSRSTPGGGGGVTRPSTGPTLPPINVNITVGGSVLSENDLIQKVSEGLTRALTTNRFNTGYSY